MADGFAILSDEHVKARELFERCLSTQDEAALRELCDALTVHAQLEEQVLYPELRRLVDGGDDYADDAEQEHAAVKVLVERVEIVAPPDLGEVVAEMQRLVEAHAAHEE